MRVRLGCWWAGCALLVIAAFGPSRANAQCPVAPTLQASAGPGGCAVSLSWNAAAFAEEYEVYRSGTLGVIGSLIDTVTGTSYTDSGVAAGTLLFYTVRPIRTPNTFCPLGLGPPSNQAAAVPTNPTIGAVGPLTVIPVCGGFNVSWGAASNAVNYRVTTTGASGFLQLDQRVVTGTSVTISLPLVPPPNLSVRVEGRDACGLGPPSSAAASTLTNPGTVQNVVATPALGCGVRVSWDPVPGANGYRIERSVVGGNTSTIVSLVLAGSVYTDTQAPRNVELRYCVLAENSCGSSTFSGCSTLSSGPGIVLPSFSVQSVPTNQKRLVGQTAQFSLSLSSSSNATYQWRKNGVSLVDNTRITGSTTPQLTISGVVPSDADLYDVVVTQGIATPQVFPAALLVENPCRPDFDSNGVRNIDDIFVFLNAWFAGCP